jgi:hypothetical protein
VKKLPALALSFMIWLSPALDFIRGPLLFRWIWHRLVKVRPLTEAETEVASQVFGPPPERFRAVRLASGGILASIFKRNGKRAFTTFHTINFPEDDTLDVLVHELAHVLQFEKAGARYMWEALKAQHELADAYSYGGPGGLAADFNSQKAYQSYNREQQAQIIQDYYLNFIANQRSLPDDQRQAYEHCLAECRAGNL